MADRSIIKPLGPCCAPPRRHPGHLPIGALARLKPCASSPNLQQLPSAKAPEFKACVVAAPGCVLVGGDWSQIEMRAAAWISRDPALTAVYEQERDLHTETAAVVAGVSPAEVSATQRQGAKAVNFGSIYGVGPRTLAENAFDTYGIDMHDELLLEVAEAEPKLPARSLKKRCLKPST